MIAIFSPWPGADEPEALKLAAQELSNATGFVDGYALASRFGPVAGELIQRYAPGAPQAVKNEAAIRIIGWLKDQPAFALRRTENERGQEVEYQTAQNMSALRHSGAMALLTAWKIRRGGAI